MRIKLKNGSARVDKSAQPELITALDNMCDLAKKQFEMKQEDKDLLLKDLCTRLPYGVKVAKDSIKGWQSHLLTGIKTAKPTFNYEVLDIDGDYGWMYMKGAKSVLFPLSALTKEITINGYNDGKPFVPFEELKLETYLPEITFDELFNAICYEGNKGVEVNLLPFSMTMLDCFHKWHIDYRGLIDRGLAVSVYELDKNPYE